MKVYTMVKNSSLIYYEVIEHDQNYNGIKSNAKKVGYTDESGYKNIIKKGFNESYLINKERKEVIK